MTQSNWKILKTQTMKYLKIAGAFICSIFITTLFLSCNNTEAAKEKNTVANTSGTSGSGKDYYYESTVTSNGKNMSINELIKMYVSSKGDIRMESIVQHLLAGNIKTEAPIILISTIDKPNESIMIDDSAKTYTINVIDTASMNDDDMKISSTVTKIGNEKIMGFDCVHARVISNKSMDGFYNSIDTINIWKSNDVPQEPSVKSKMDNLESGKGNAMYSTEAAQQLKDMGCTGFTVKMTTNSKDYSMIIQLNKVERKDLPANLFEIPAGYKEEKD